MRWDRLFDDLEGQLEQELSAERVDEVAEEERLRLGRLSLRDRMLAMATGGRRDLDLVLRDGTPLRLELESAGRDWIAGELVAPGIRSTAIVPVDAVASVVPHGDQLARGLAPAPAPSPGDGLAARLGLAFVLRDLCRRRVPLHLLCEWAELHGTLDRVGRDHVDVAEHDPGTFRRGGEVRRIRLVPLPTILRIRF